MMEDYWGIKKPYGTSGDVKSVMLHSQALSSLENTGMNFIRIKN
jgi:hypothetical protein